MQPRAVPALGKLVCKPCACRELAVSEAFGEGTGAPMLAALEQMPEMPAPWLQAEISM
jgi:hypothetical protein